MSKYSDWPYRAVVDQITHQIAKGDLVEGDVILSVAKLAEEFNLSRGTIDRAVLILEDRRLLRGERGRARYVAPGAQARAEARLAEDAAWDALYPD